MFSENFDLLELQRMSPHGLNVISFVHPSSLAAVKKIEEPKVETVEPQVVETPIQEVKTPSPPSETKSKPKHKTQSKKKKTKPKPKSQELPTKEKHEVPPKPRKMSAPDEKTEKTKASQLNPALEQQKAMCILIAAKAFEPHDFIEVISQSIKKENDPATLLQQELNYNKLCNGVKFSLAQNGQLQQTVESVMPPGTDVKKCDAPQLYAALLKARVSICFGNYAKTFFKVGIFDLYKPEDRPILFYMAQKEFVQKDIFPSSVDVCLSLNHAIEANLVPKNIKTYMERGLDSSKKWRMYCCGLFHGFIHQVNYVTALYRSEDGHWSMSMVLIDRFTKPEDNIIALAF